MLKVNQEVLICINTNQFNIKDHHFFNQIQHNYCNNFALPNLFYQQLKEGTYGMKRKQGGLHYCSFLLPAHRTRVSTPVGRLHSWPPTIPLQCPTTTTTQITINNLHGKQQMAESKEECTYLWHHYLQNCMIIFSIHIFYQHSYTCIRFLKNPY